MKQFFTLALGLAATSGLTTPDWVAPVQAIDAPSTATEMAQTEMPVEEATESVSSHSEEIALNFDPPQSPSTAATRAVEGASPPDADNAATTERPVAASREDLFDGGSESIVARTVGAAEGTRSPDGGKTDIHEGHIDPGNGVWNRGTFSYQFGNEENLSAEEADRRQLAKIKRIYESVMLPQAERHGVAPLTLAEELNGIDLINQAPLAVTETGGYIERLAEAKTKKGLSGQEAILDARIWAFWDPSRGGWDAPGLRAYDDMGKEASIRHDQKRRMGMIDEALAAYEQQHGAIAARPATPSSKPAVAGADTQTAVASRPEPQSADSDSPHSLEQRADAIIFGHSLRSENPVAMVRP